MDALEVVHHTQTLETGENGSEHRGVRCSPALLVTGQRSWRGAPSGDLQAPPANLLLNQLEPEAAVGDGTHEAEEDQVPTPVGGEAEPGPRGQQSPRPLTLRTGRSRLAFLITRNRATAEPRMNPATTSEQWFRYSDTRFRPARNAEQSVPRQRTGLARRLDLVLMVLVTYIWGAQGSGSAGSGLNPLTSLCNSR